MKTWSEQCILQFYIHGNEDEILLTSHKSWMNHEPFLESLQETNPGTVLYAIMRSPYSETLVGDRDPGAAPGAGAYIPPPNGVSVT